MTKKPETTDIVGPFHGSTEDGTGQTGGCFPSMSDCICSGSKFETSSFQTVSNETNITFP